MSELYDALEARRIDREEADSLANIAGKFLKAEQLQLAKAIFEAQYPPGRAGARSLPNKTSAQ